MNRRKAAALLSVALIVSLAALYLSVSGLPTQPGAATCNVTTAACSASGNTTFTTATSNATDKVGRPVYLALAYSPSCPHCEVVNAFLVNLTKTYDIRTSYINVLTNQTALPPYFLHYNVPESDWGVVPVLFVGNTYRVGGTAIISFLSDNMPQLAQSGVPPPVLGQGTLGTLTILEVTGLALVDSINPCAFAVLIFFLSTLFMWDPSRKYRLLLGGVSFAAGIFAFYFAIGAALVLGMQSVLAVTGLQNVYVYGAFGIFSIALGALNLKDYFAYGKFGFVMEVPRRLRPSMLGTIDRVMLGRVAYMPAAFVAGVLVTAFLLPCISGPYFIAGSLLKDLPFGTALAWIAYYNFLFVLPMLVITALVYLSFTSVEKASGFRERNLKRLHLVAGVLLILVGVIMLSSFVV